MKDVKEADLQHKRVEKAEKELAAALERESHLRNALYEIIKMCQLRKTSDHLLTSIYNTARQAFYSQESMAGYPSAQEKGGEE